MEQTLPVILAQPWRVILVDYSDPQRIGSWAERRHHPRLQVVRCEARLDATRRPIQSQARAWQAGVDALPADGVATVVLADALAVPGERTAEMIARLPAGEAWWQGDLLLALPARLARAYRQCPAYVGASAEAADLRARLVAAGEPLREVALGARLASRPLPPPLASVRLLGQRSRALGWAGPSLAALGRLGGGPVSERNH